MLMSYESLCKSGKIKKIEPSAEEVKEIMSLADRDLKMSGIVVSQDWDWSFSIAYNACLQASRAFMHSKGYRPSSFQGHKNTFEFMQAALGDKCGELIGFLDRMRPKRNRAIYDTAGLITETEAKELLEKAKEYVRIIKAEL